MFAKRAPQHSATGSAAIARARLMVDPATRNNAGLPQKPATLPSAPGLSAADQKLHVLHVLRSFDHFHLADLTYDAARQSTTAIFRPDQDHHDVPHRVQIDARGNLLVTQLGSYDIPAHQQNWQRWLLGSVTLAIMFLALYVLI